jgi:hypothetical protein
VQAQQTARRPDWVPPLASALIPGSGQLIKKQDRGVIYLIADVLFLQRFVSQWAQAQRDEARYRDLAFRVARASYSPMLADTVFEYFEQMGVFVESGPFDTDDGPPLVPPLDEDTYNGRTWALARRTFFLNPDVMPDTASLEYRQALEFYRRRAVGPNFRWSWRAAVLEQDLFRQSIVQGDDAFRRATGALGLLLANRFLSMVDVFVSQRLSRRGMPVQLEHRLRFQGGPARLDVGFRIGR